MVTGMDGRIIHFTRTIFLPMARFAIFLIFFWFGLLKVAGASPASPMALALLEKTLPFITPDTFLLCFGLLEMFIGLVFLIPHFERFAIFLLALHMISTVLPLFMLRDMVWASPFVPTLEGQYIIKNVLIIALAIGISTHLKPGKM